MLRRSLALAAVLLLAAPALAQDKIERVSLSIMVTHASPEPGPIDPSAADLHRQLSQDFRYRSLRVLQRESLRLKMDEIGKMKLPNGRWVRVRPLHRKGNRLLLSVQVEGALDTDLRLRNHRKVSIGSHRYKDGTLVITFEPNF